jgi:DHA2 family multidrug resistance protein
MLIRRADYHRSVLAEHITPFSNIATERIHTFAAMFTHTGAAVPEANQKAMALISTMIQKQALAVSFEDLSYMLAVSLLVTLPFVFALSSGKKRALPADAH